GGGRGGGGIEFSDGKELRWGRLAMENGYGSELLPLVLPLRAEYWNGSAFVLNGDDGCTALAANRLTLTSAVVPDREPGVDPIRINGVTSNTTTAQVPSAFAGGVGDLLFTGPGSGGEGWVNVAVRLNGFSFGAVAYEESRPWLRFDWDGDGSHDDDPAARATFGIFRNDDSIIYWREAVD
ncbi:MAG: hypothetical protein JXB25_09470, partial [Deltaproteobacteria bacterium]|nr:hypothetical protein [Deltaproteobacteria bacterium]